MIISASRRTDIPAFHSEKFMNDIRNKFFTIKNPYSNIDRRIDISPEILDCIVFWTKDPEPLIPHLKELDDLGYKYYFQFTLTAYNEDIEPAVHDKTRILETFKSLSNLIGKEKVIWRYDPILLTTKYSLEYHTQWFEFIFLNLQEYTNKCVISFIDIYQKNKKKLEDIGNIEINGIEKNYMLKRFKDIINNKITLCSCSENSLDIPKNACIDGDLISKITNKNISNKKDKNQRKECGCIPSIDIGNYNTCYHKCIYCYAN